MTLHKELLSTPNYFPQKKFSKKNVNNRATCVAFQAKEKQTIKL